MMEAHIIDLFTIEMSTAFAAVRAEATLAGAVAEREACAKVADDFDDDQILGADIAAAIRARRS